MSNHLCVSAAEFKVILDRDRVLCYMYTIRKIDSVQHSTVYIILT